MFVFGLTVSTASTGLTVGARAALRVVSRSRSVQYVFGCCGCGEWRGLVCGSGHVARQQSSQPFRYTGDGSRGAGKRRWACSKGFCCPF